MKRPRSCSSTLLSLVAPALALLVSCSSTTEPPSGDPHIDLTSADPRVRILGARAAAETSRDDLLEDLSQALSDADPAVRMFADIALRKMTSQDFDFKPHGTAVEREEARGKWVDWIAARKKSNEKATDGAGTASDPGAAAGSSSVRKEVPKDGSAQRS